MPGKPQQDPYRLVKYVARGALDGAMAGCILLLLLKYLNIGNIGTLIQQSPDGALVYAIAFMLFSITFGMVGIAWRIMVLLPQEDE